MAKKSRPKKTQSKKVPAKSTARSLVDEVEKAGESLLKEIRDGFDTITDKVSVAARTAAEGIADTTSSVAERVSKSHASHQIRNALEQIEVVGERVLDTISDRFEVLRNKVIDTSKPAQKKTVKKKATKKAAKKVVKKAAKRKPLAKKAAKKKVAKKAVKKKAAKKKTTLKKAAKKKVSAKGKKS